MTAPETELIFSRDGAEVLRMVVTPGDYVDVFLVVRKDGQEIEDGRFFSLEISLFLCFLLVEAKR